MLRVQNIINKMIVKKKMRAKVKIYLKLRNKVLFMVISSGKLLLIWVKKLEEAPELPPLCLSDRPPAFFESSGYGKRQFLYHNPSIYD